MLKQQYRQILVEPNEGRLFLDKNNKIFKGILNVEGVRLGVNVIFYKKDDNYIAHIRTSHFKKFNPDGTYYYVPPIPNVDVECVYDKEKRRYSGKFFFAYYLYSLYLYKVVNNDTQYITCKVYKNYQQPIINKLKENNCL